MTTASNHYLAFAKLVSLTLLAPITFSNAADAKDQGQPDVIRSARSGRWSAPATWVGNKTPGSGARVLIREGHTVVYDVQSTAAIRAINVAGTLSFAANQDTRLDVGLIKIQAGDEYSEDGFDCDAHIIANDAAKSRPALEVGTPELPIAAGRTALIRLMYFPGMDRQSCPAIVCCSGRMDFHGAPLNRTWVKLGATAKANDIAVTTDEAVAGWRIGDKIIITATRLTRDLGGAYGQYSTEERSIAAIDAKRITLDRPLAHEHLGAGEYRGEVANLNRNVVVESADRKLRGHTMYHRGSAGAISYAEFRHLGKEGVLGRYSLHYHLVGDTMRGSSVIGASIWDSGNRWLTIHGTNFLVVRDCVGYQSVGHGFFLEDGTEVYNVLDRNLAVQARHGKPLPKQVLPFDQNEGAGFWWANSRNTFTRNVTCENDRYGYRFEATPTSALKLTLRVMQPDGSRKLVDIRTLPFVRFDDNEAHCDGLYGLNLGEGVERVGPDNRHPFVIRNTKLWEVHYAFRPQSPSVLVENMRIHKGSYGVYHPNFDNHVYRNLHISASDAEPFNRGHDDFSVQYGKLAVDGLTFAKCYSGDYMPLIQISDDNPTGAAESHFRNVKTIDWTGSQRRALVNLGGGPRPKPTTEKGVPIYLHDWFGPGKHAKIVSTRSREPKADGRVYREAPQLTGDESRVAELGGVEFPQLLDPTDDLPPQTIITGVIRHGPTSLLVRGTTADNGAVKGVLVNAHAARATAPNFAQWEILLENLPGGAIMLQAHAADAAGNVEPQPQVVRR